MTNVLSQQKGLASEGGKTWKENFSIPDQPASFRHFMKKKK